MLDNMSHHEAATLVTSDQEKDRSGKKRALTLTQCVIYPNSKRSPLTQAVNIYLSIYLHFNLDASFDK